MTETIETPVELKKRDPITSPSGRYVLQVSEKATKPGCWNYTIGELTRVDTGESIAVVNRNYHSFPYAWVEGHPNGHDYLVCGADYQGQTVIELDTGKRKDFLPEAAKKGHGFCWVQYSFNAELKLLVVNGCFWACPYETRFYDFSDPMEKGWAELEFPEEMYAYDDEKDPEISEGKITIFETRCLNEDEEDEDREIREVVSRTTYRPEGLKLVLVEKWVDPKEQARRDERDAAQAKWEAEWEEYKNTDPLFLLVKERVASDDLYNPSWGSVSIGQCYPGWCADFTGSDSRICRRLADRKVVGETTFTIDLEWGRKIAPVKIIVFRDKGKGEDFWFERSLEGMTKALDFVRDTLSPKAS